MSAEFSKNVEQAATACDRYEAIAGHQRGYKRMNLMMDLLAADGVNGNRPIDWDRLLVGDEFNLLHDLSGISRHIDRDTGTIGDHFIPRFAKRSLVAA